ncbi:hypothetical protein E4U47_004139 [Claviceps purpurea]|nr:hypothetical protein E4U47_004139 [Claviceps purpurea]
MARDVFCFFQWEADYTSRFTKRSVALFYNDQWLGLAAWQWALPYAALVTGVLMIRESFMNVVFRT